MRDIKRISIILDLLKRIWIKCPDIRFNQLIHNLTYEYNNRKGNVYGEWLSKKDEFGWVSETYHIDLFYVEDDDFIKFLEEKVKDL